jgi:hypothetical protein
LFSSLDQTTRIHGAVSKTDENSDSCKAWYELSRPQVHGHDLLDAAFLDPLKFISIADEKVARVFEAPRGFIHVINGLGVTELAAEEVCFLLYTVNQVPNGIISRVRDILAPAFPLWAYRTKLQTKVSSLHLWTTL